MYIILLSFQNLPREGDYAPYFPQQPNKTDESTLWILKLRRDEVGICIFIGFGNAMRTQLRIISSEMITVSTYLHIECNQICI